MIKHPPPVWCRIRRTLVGYSPSAALHHCAFGLQQSCPKCEGCTENIAEIIHEGFIAGLTEGLSMPYFRICPRCGAYLDPDEICDCKYGPSTINTAEGEQ